MRMKIILGLWFSLAGFYASSYSYAEFKKAQQEVVLLNNQQDFLPIKELQNQDFYSYQIPYSFDSIASFYTQIHRLQQLKKLPKNATLFLGITNVAELQIIKNLAIKNVVLVVFKDKNLLEFLPTETRLPILFSETNDDAHQSVVAQIIFGGIAALKTKNCSSFESFSTSSMRLGYSFPEEVGARASKLDSIDLIAKEAIDLRCTPGCVVLVAQKGKVIFQKAYGNYTYEALDPLTCRAVFDLASITKIAATTLAVMHLYENQQLTLEDSLAKYIPQARGTNKENIILKDLMLHQAQLVPFIPFYKNMQHHQWSKIPTAKFTLQVAQDYFVEPDFFRTVMLPKMLQSPLLKTKKYEYSDLSMYFMREVVEKTTHCGIEDFLNEKFYYPLGLQTMFFNPKNTNIDVCNIPPTEQDSTFRCQTVRGYVHDQGAALAGGVAGHAGLFSTANDLAILFQMMLNGGEYAKKNYFKPKTIDFFTSTQSSLSRRGLGFDKYDPAPSKAYPCHHYSEAAYGHTGFTGTCVWIDPKNQLIYIFLSNRLYETSHNKLSSFNIRGRIQDLVYEALEN